MVISWIVSLVFIHELGSRLKRGQFIAISVVALLIFLIPTIKWFNSSWYLTAGSTWSEEVELARMNCLSGPTSVQLNIGGISTTELPCAYIKHN
jgi:hypothetical protein